MANQQSKIKVDVLFPSNCKLGEGAMWFADRNAFCWVDIEGREIFELEATSKKVQRYQLPSRVSFITPGKNGKMILAMEGGLFRMNLDAKTVELVSDLGIEWEGLRCNDGVVDDQGRVWISTMALDQKENAGSVYLVDTNGNVSEKIKGVTIPNGMAWSKDGKHLFFVDTTNGEIYRYDYEAATGDITNRTLVIEVPGEKGKPDGMTIDKDDNLWVALWGGASILKCNPATGEILDSLDIPALNVSSCCFAGAGLDLLLVTTAKDGMQESELAEYPESGHVFIIKLETKGTRDFKCGL